MRAIIEIDVPDYQIGQEVSIYFKDTMMIKGVVKEQSGNLISRDAVLDAIEELKKIHFDRVVVLNKVRDRVLELQSVNLQEKTGHWIAGRSTYFDVEMYRCSECKSWSAYKAEKCPNCHVRMVGDDNG